MSEIQRNAQPPAKEGCLIINLGSPSKPTHKEIRRFLRKFLSDKRVVTAPRAVWLPVLYGIVLPFRPKKVAAGYRHIWMETGSPLIVHTRAQAAHLAKELPDVMVRHAFTYCEPTVAKALGEMMDAGVTDLTVITLYPQYAPSTVGATIDQVTAFFRKYSKLPHLRIVSEWYDETNYIQWYADRFETEINAHRPDRLLFSYHSLPEAPIHCPDDYKRHCWLTTNAILDELRRRGVDVPDVLQTYQSTFGPSKWIGPATIDTVGELPKQGVKNILVATPGFISDCIETIDEIGLLNRETFEAAGGEKFTLIAPPNSDEATGKMLASVYAAQR